MPLLLIALMFGTAYFSSQTFTTKNIALFIEHEDFKDAFENTDNLNYTYLNEEPSLEDIKSELDNGVYDAYIKVPQFDVFKNQEIDLLLAGELGIEFEQRLNNALNSKAIELRMADAGIDKNLLESINERTIKIKSSDTKGKSSSAEIALIIGYGSGFLLYFFMLFYGMNVMTSVMEEKTNRIAEIIVSSVTPFQLMLGKIIGVALVGLTQFLIWGVLLFGISIVLGISGLFTGMDPATSSAMMQGAADMPFDPSMIDEIALMVSQINWLSIIFWFFFFFLGGYFLYAALYAAVGSLVNENAQEGQQYTIPITLPIIFAMVIMTSTMQDPHNGLAVFGSIFPMTSPIVMMARIPYGVPGWQLVLSAISLILGFILATWIAAKIYRTGILMYGKKITFKEVGKWIIKK